MKKIKVMKFGGTSLKSKEDRNHVLNILKEELENYKLVVVVSAMGRYPDAYATDTLLTFSNELSKKQKDELLSCGEMISSHLICNEARLQKMNCTCLSVFENGIHTDMNFGDAKIVDVDTNVIYETLKKYDIVFVPGFFGSHQYYVTTLGRGGSDLSAVVLADALGLKEVTIYSDVAGIYSADPKQVSDACLYSHVHYQQALQLASLNVPVLQYKACLYAYQKHVTMILKSTFRKEGQTIVSDDTCFHPFLINHQEGYYYLNTSNHLFNFQKNLTLKQAHTLFIE